MASTCAIYKGSRQIGTGSVSDGSATVSSFIQTDNIYTTKALGVWGRWVTVVITQSGTHLGRSFNSKIHSDDGAGTVTLRHACPFIHW